MKAKVTIEYVIPNLGDDEKEFEPLSFTEMVRLLIDEEGILGICDDEQTRILKIEKMP